MSEEKQMTPLSELIEKAKEWKQSGTSETVEIFFSTFDEGWNRAMEQIKKDAESLLPKEKQMVVDAFSDGFANVITGEHYFNKTYNQ